MGSEDIQILRYSAAFVSWRKSELQARKEGGKGLISIEDCAELAIRGLEVYVLGSEERLMQAARGDKIDGSEAASVLKRSKKKKRLED